MSKNILEKISAQVQLRMEDRKKKVPLRDLEILGAAQPQAQSLKNAFLASELSVLSEIKYASPSQGAFALAAGLSPAAVARDYLTHGAVALSVLTEQDFFGGSLQNLIQIRKEFPKALLLMKDFISDPYQIFEAKHYGADAVLLIVALLGKEKLKEFLALSRDCGLSVLVEVHNLEELLMAQDLGADLIGINNRNLKTLEVSLEVSLNLAQSFDPQTVHISESGLSTHADLLRLQEVGYQGFLIGSSLMKTGKPGLALRQILGEEERGRI